MGHIRKLVGSAAYRRATGEFLCDSPKLLQEALLWQAEITAVVTISPLPRLPEYIRQVQVPEDVMASISPVKTPQGVLFTCRLPQAPLPRSLTGRRYVLLDGVQDPGNVGTILRTLDAFDADGLLLTGKDVLGKQELIILDMLQTNDWNRPIYYAITVSPDQFVKLDPYFQQTGMAYQIVPMETQGTVRSINTEKMYDNVMNKFKWGGVNTPGVYLDENVMRMCKSYRIALFSKLAAALVAEGKNEKALNVLDKAMEVLPPENVPLDYSALSLGELYYELGQKEKAEMVYKGIADNALRSINWYFRLRPGQLSSVESDLGHNLAVLQEVLRVSKQYNPEFAKPYQEEFDNYRMAYGSVAKD